MTMPAWPFSPVHAPSYPVNGVPTAAEINLLQEQVAVAADGRAWTDVAALKSWKYDASLTGLKARGAYDPVSRRWIVLANNTGLIQRNWTITGSRWFATGLGSIGSPTTLDGSLAAAIGVGANAIMIGGAPTSASTAKLRESTDGGATWTPRNIGASDTQQVPAIAYSSSLARWSCSVGTVGGDGLYTSTDRITWSFVAAAIPQWFAIRETPSPILIGNALIAASPSGNYVRSTNGIAWTTATLPENVSSAQACWSDALGKFFMSGATGIWSSADGTTGSWTKIYSGTEQCSLASFGRALVRGDGKASLDGGVSWFAVADVNGQNDFTVAVSPTGVLLQRTTSNDILLSQQIGF